MFEIKDKFYLNGEEFKIVSIHFDIKLHDFDE